MNLEEKIKAGKFPILVSLPKNDIELAKAALKGGADGVKIHLNAFHRASGNRFGSFSEELPFLMKFAELDCAKLVMIGQEQIPTDSELEQLRMMGFEGFNLYLRHCKPYLFRAGVRPILALEHDYGRNDFDAIREVKNAWVEASIVPGEKYGTPLDAGDLEAYQTISRRLKKPVIVPSQKKIATTDLPKLIDAGVSALLIGVIVTGSTAESITQTIRTFQDAKSS